MILPYVKYGKVTNIYVPDSKKIETLSRIILVINFFALIVSASFVIIVWSSVTEYSLFKGQRNYQQDIFMMVPINTKFLTLSSFFSSTSFFSLGFHFYYLYCKKYKRAILFLIASLSMPLRMLVYFSRSALILFSFLYILYLILLFQSYNKATLKIIKRIAICFISLILIVFMIISVNRFSTGESFDSGTLAGLLDYGGQWYKHGVELLSNYHLTSLNGELSDSFIDWVSSFFNAKPDLTNVEIRQNIWPNHYYKFIGLVTILTYDFGVIFTILFTLLYSYIVYLLMPRKGVISIFSLLVFGVIVTLPLMNFVGNYMEDHMYGCAVFTSIIIYIYLKIKF